MRNEVGEVEKWGDWVEQGKGKVEREKEKKKGGEGKRAVCLEGRLRTCQINS